MNMKQIQNDLLNASQEVIEMFYLPDSDPRNLENAIERLSKTLHKLRILTKPEVLK